MIGGGDVSNILEKLLLVLLDVTARAIFTLYWLVPFAALLGCLLLGLGWVIGPDHPAWRVAGNFATPWLVMPVLVLAYPLAVRRGSRENPHRQYVGWLGRMDARIDRFFAWIGTLKYFRSPWSIVEDPGGYKIRGDEIRELIDEVLQPGDILLRGYDGYLDGLLIELSGGGKGLEGYFSHAALYVGDLNDARDKPVVARRLQAMNEAGRWVEATEAQKEIIRNAPEYYEAGRQKVIHSMTKGVFVEDILTFLRCDYLVVLRLHEAPISYGPDDQRNAGQTMLIRDMAGEGRAIHDRLMSGETVDRQEILDAVRHSALGRIGSCYDFQFNNIKAAHMFSCSEFVYYCFKSIHCYIGLRPVRHAFMDRFFPRVTITPADIYAAAVNGPEDQKRLKLVWLSKKLRGRAQ